MKRQITRVVIENYRSIRHCDVRLGPLTLLVGPNGSGKSNFLDALRFLAECMHAPFDQVLNSRSGVLSVAHKRWVGGTETQFSIALEFVLETAVTGSYQLRLRPGPPRSVNLEESCRLSTGSYFDCRNREAETSLVAVPAFTGDRPALVAFGGVAEFAPVFSLLSEMTFYSPDVAAMRQPKRPSDVQLLAPNAENMADVIHVAEKCAPAVLKRIVEYLSGVLPGLKSLHVEDIRDLLRELLFVLGGISDPSLHRFVNHPFNVTQISDGTLRSLALLTALFQPALGLKRVSLVGLEEPENNLHPAAAGVLLDAMLEASADVQVIATTHSADLLDHSELPLDAILPVEMENGESIISPLGEATREIIRRNLYTPGELLRNRQLSPEPANIHE